MRIAEIIDPTPEYRRRKGELDRIIAADPLTRKVELMKSREGDDDRHIDPEYQRKLQYYDKLRKVHVARWRDLAPRVSRLRGEATHFKLRDKPSGMFVGYHTVPGVESPAYLDEIGLLIHQQNADLDFPADEAITRFVGHVHGFNSPGEVGYWSEGALENAYSDNPTEQGQLIRQQLEAGMAPIKQLLRARFGDTIYLYRSQRPLEPGQKHRAVLSWTASKRFANYHGGDKFQKVEKAIPLEDIVWITDRANQQEFICFNRRGASHYLGMNEAFTPTHLTLYNGTTPDSAKALVERGWQPNQWGRGGNMGQTRYLYLTTDIEDAVWFANEKGSSTVVEVRNVPIDYLIPDPEDATGETVEQELASDYGLPAKLALTHALGPEHFRVVRA